MKILQNYLGKQIIWMILIVACALLGLDLFFYLINELKLVGKGNYDLSAALVFVMLTIPRKIYIMFPWSALLGSLLALGQAAKASELVVMRAAAVSVQQIAWAAIRAVLLLTCIMFGFGELIAPVVERFAQQHKIAALSLGQAMQTDQGIWVRNNNEFINIKTVLVNKQLQGITKYTFNDQLELQAVIYAATAYQVDQNWYLTDITGTKFNNSDPNAVSKQAARLAVTTKIVADHMVLPNLLNTEILEASGVKHLERLSLLQLYRVIQQRKSNELNIQNYAIAFWTKVYQPFNILLMVYLIIPFVFGPLRSASVGLRLVVGILVGFSFHVGNAIAAQLPVVFQISPVLALAIMPILFTIIGVILMQRVK